MAYAEIFQYNKHLFFTPVCIQVVIVGVFLPHHVLLADLRPADPLPYGGQGVLTAVGEVAVAREEPRGVEVEGVVAAPAGGLALGLAVTDGGYGGEVVKVVVAVIVPSTGGRGWGY